MTALKGVSVKRGGQTAHNWYETIKSVAVDTTSEEMRLKFSMSSKGGGRTQVQVELKPESFDLILQNMALVDPDVAIRAMTAELERQIKLQPARQKTAIKKAEEDLLDHLRTIAQKKFRPNWFQTDTDEQKVKRVIYDGFNAVMAEANIGKLERKSD